MKVLYYDNTYYVSDSGKIKNTKGRILGSIGNDGYVHLVVKQAGKRVNVRIHKIIWKAFNGAVPCGNEIDHINGDKADNRIINLQLLNHRENTRKSVVGVSGFSGVSWSKSKQKWRVQISINNKRFHLGYKNSINEAKMLYNKTLSEYENI